MTYSIDFRKKVLCIKAKERLSFAATGLRFGLGRTTIVNWSKSIAPKMRRNKTATKIDMQALSEDCSTLPRCIRI